MTALAAILLLASTTAAPFDRPLHLLLNFAIGGGLAESRGIGGVDETGYPKRFEIDWVRVWQCDDDAASRADCTISGEPRD